MNVTKMKVMISGCSVGKPPEEVKFPCSTCGKGVGTCKQCIHKKCSGISGRLKDDNQFVCKRFTTTEAADDIEKLHLDGKAIEVVQKFSYLEDTIEAQGWCDSKS